MEATGLDNVPSLDSVHLLYGATIGLIGAVIYLFKALEKQKRVGLAQSNDFVQNTVLMTKAMERNTDALKDNTETLRDIAREIHEVNMKFDGDLPGYTRNR